MSSRARFLAWAFAALSLVHASLGFVFPDLPAWKMFRVIPRYRYEVTDARGQDFRVHDWVQRRAYVMSAPIFLFEIAQWLVEREPEVAPLVGSITIWTNDGPATRGFTIVPGPNGPRVLERALPSEP